MQAFSAARFILEEPGTKQTSVLFHGGSGATGTACIQSILPLVCLLHEGIMALGVVFFF